MNEPKLIEHVLDSPKCLDKSFFYKFLKLDKGLLDANRKLIFDLLRSALKIVLIILDELWQKDRKALECLFMPQIVKGFVPIFVDCADQMLESLKTIDDKNCVDIFSVTSRCSLTMVLSTSFGMSAANVQFNEEILKAVEE